MARLGRDLAHLEEMLSGTEGAEKAAVLCEIAWLKRTTAAESAVRAAAEVCRIAEDNPETSPLAGARAFLTLAWANALEGDYDLARDQIARADGLREEDEDDSLRADALLAAGYVEMTAGQPGRAVPAFEEALGLYETANDVTGQEETHGHLGGAHFQLGDVDRACEHYEHCERLMGADTSLADLARVQLSLGAIRYRKGDLSSALRAIFKSMEMFQKARDNKGFGMAQANLSRIYRDLGESEKALDFILNSLEAVRQAKDRVAEARILAEVARTHVAVGAMEDALEAARESLTISREIDRPYSEAEALDALGNVYRLLGRDEEALTSLESALEVNRAIGNRKGEGDCLYLIGEIHRQANDLERASASYEESLATHRELDNRRGEGWTLLSIGILRARMGDRESALLALEEADEIAMSIDYKALAIRTGQEITDLHSQAGRYQEAFKSHRSTHGLERKLRAEKSEARLQQIRHLREAEREAAALDLKDLAQDLVDWLESARKALADDSREDLGHGLDHALADARRLVTHMEEHLSRSE